MKKVHATRKSKYHHFVTCSPKEILSWIKHMSTLILINYILIMVMIKMMERAVMIMMIINEGPLVNALLVTRIADDY